MPCSRSIVMSAPPDNGQDQRSGPQPDTPSPFNPQLPPHDPVYLSYLQQQQALGTLPTQVPSLSFNDLGPAAASGSRFPGAPPPPDTAFATNIQSSTFATAPGFSGVSAIAAAAPQVQGPSGSTRRQRTPKQEIPGTSEFKISDGSDSSDSMEEYRKWCKCNKTFQKPKRHWKKSCIYNRNRDGPATCERCGIEITNRQDNLVRHMKDVHGVTVDE